MENLGVFVGIEDVGEVLAVGVGNENLPEIIALYHLDNPFHPLAVQAIEDIIKEQYWLLAVSCWLLAVTGLT